MDWWQVLIALFFIFPTAYVIFYEIFFCGIKSEHKYSKKRKQWDSEHPDLTRLKCKDCKYSKKETYWCGRYPNGYPQRIVVYCSLIKRKIDQGSSCQLAEPPIELCEP